MATADSGLGPLGAMLDRVLVERCRRLTHGAPPRVPNVGWGAGEPIESSRAVADNAPFMAWLAGAARVELDDIAHDEAERAARVDRWRARDEPIARALLHAREQQQGTLPVTADLLTSASVRWERASSGFTVESPRLFACLIRPCASVEVELGASLEVRCAGSPAPCRLKLLALERLLEIIARPTASEAEARAHLVAPQWQQVFDRLRHVAAEPVPAKLGWVLKDAELALCLVEAKAAGGWKAKALSPSELAEVELSDASDALVATLMSHKLPAYERPQLHADRLARMLAALVGRDNVFAKVERELAPFAVQRADPRIEVVDDRVAVRWGEQLVPTKAAPTPGSWAHIMDASARVIRVGFWSRAACRAWQVLAEAAPIPEAAMPALADTLLEVARAVPVKRDARWLGEGHAPASDVVFRLGFEGPRGARRLTIEGRVRPLPELGALVPGQGEPVVAVRKGGRVGHVVRAFDAEREAVDLVAQAVGLVIDEGADGPARFDWTLVGLDAAMPVWSALQAQASALVHLEWQTVEPTVHQAKASQLQMRMGVRRDWLDIEGGLGLDGAELPLRELLNALRDRKRYVALADGHIVEISAALRRELAPLEAVERHGERLRASVASAPIVEALAAVGVDITGTPEWLAAHDRLREAATMIVGIPTDLRATLRPYQADGITWLVRLGHWARGACLADDMGLGKTLQALGLLLHRAGQGRALIVAPTSVVPNWLRETERFAPTLALQSIARGGDIGRLDAGTTIVTSWDLLVRHEARFALVPWATVILDEAHAVKNPATRRASVARSLNAEFVVALTGTPLENRPSELWSLFQVVAPGLLGSAEAFREAYGRQIELAQPEPAQRLARLIRPFLLRRRKGEVATDLPPRSEVRVDVVLPASERERYERVRRSAMAELKRRDRDHNINGHQSMLRVLVVLMRLRQLACHPRLVDPTAPDGSAKLERLVELVEELREQGRKVLVFSQFTELLALVRAAFDAAGMTYTYLDGTTPSEHRIAEVDRFQSGVVDAFLLSLKAGGSGLNLTTATEVIHLDPWWNPAAEDQASDRAHRIGQDRPVTIYRLVSQGTIEEQIQGLQLDKRKMVASVLEGTTSSQAITVDELMALLSADGLDVDTPQG